MLSSKSRKLIVILGPTASGKSDLAVKLALKFNGEVVSADSRQVYKGMDIGSGKITPDTKNSSNFSTGQAKKKYIFTHRGIPHYCIDVASPKRRFTVAQFQKLAWKAIKDIWKRGKLPILCGGTGLYIQSIVDGLAIPAVPPDAKLRKELEKLSTTELFQRLKKIDPRRAKNIDKHNRRRLIRALEIVIKTGKPVPPLSVIPAPPSVIPAPPSVIPTPPSVVPISSSVIPAKAGIQKLHINTANRLDPLLRGDNNNISILQLGLDLPKDQLVTRIKKRLYKRLRQGMVAEVKKLRRDGVLWKRLEEFGLEYRAIAQYLQGKISKPGSSKFVLPAKQEMINKIQKESEQYAKRQITWFKRDKRINWIKNYKEAEKLTRQFLS